MRERARFCAVVAVAFGAAIGCIEAHADPQALERARTMLGSGNAKQAYAELAPLQDKLSGEPEFDYLLGVSALDSGRLEESIIAFERVLALIPNHAGAQMDLARAYYAAGSFDLAEASFIKLRESNPPPAAQQAIGRYLEAIQARKTQTQAGWTGYGELGLGYDSNITGVPTDFGAAAQQSFNLTGVQPTGNAVKRSAGFVGGVLGAEYSKPIARGWSLFAGGDARGRAYRNESDFNSSGGEVRAGGALNSGPNQWRASASYLIFDQEGDAPGDPKPTNDRRMAGLALDWRHALDPKTQLGLGLQVNRVRFPENSIEDFDQVYVSASWLKSFERKGIPLLYLTVFATDDRAPNKFAEDITKSKNLYGLRSYLQYSIGPKLQVFNALGLVHRRDKDPFARSTTVQSGRDTFAEASIGASWQFRDRCALRLIWAYSRNSSNIDIYDFDRNEVSSNIRCELS
jgi:hypothetical protein